MDSLFLFKPFNVSLLRNVDTIQELSDILMLDGCALLDSGSRLGHRLNAVALNHKLVLLLGRGLNGYTTPHFHLADVLLTQEVTDLYSLVVVSDNAVDGEMGIYSTHLVLESLGHTLNHVADVGADSAHSSHFLALAKPFLDGDFGTFLSLLDKEVDFKELEGALQPSTLALNGHDAVLDLDGHILGDKHRLIGADSPHGCSYWRPA